MRLVQATSEAAPTGKTVELSTLEGDYEAQNGDVLTGVTTSHKVTIAAGATVTLDGVTISRSSYCIKCLGDATIILKDGSTNTLTGTGDEYPALSIGDANTTLTIQGSTGVLNVTSGECCAGIGGGYMNTNKTCGNIRIEGGVITAQGGSSGSGIGSDCGQATCGDIIITGGTITAKGGSNAAGIGTGTGSGSVEPAVCGDITIANTVTNVTATKGTDAAHSIGKGFGGNATCGTVTIGCTLDTNGNPVGGTKYWENNAAVNGGATYLAQATIEYPAAASLIVNPAVGQFIGSDGKNYADKAAATSAGTTAVAIICYVGDDNCEDAPYNHGLALALSDANSGNFYVWSTSTGSTVHTYYTDNSAFAGESGLQYNASHNTDDYPAFKYAIANNGTAAPTGCSSWFLPSGYQWHKMTAEGYDYLGLEDANYWTSTEYDEGYAWYFSPGMVRGYPYTKNYNNNKRVRSCLAF